MEIKFKKEPHPQQEIFLDRDEPEQLFGGAKRGGKSIGLCQKTTLLNVMFPGNRGLLARYNFTDLQDTTLTEYFETVPSELILNHHKGDRMIILRTIDPRSVTKELGTKDGYSRFASRQLYRGLGDPEEFEKVKGISLGHLAIDEPSEVPLEQYLMLRAQFDWKLAREKDGSYRYGQCPPYMSLLASNPEPGWVEDRFPISRPYIAVGGKVFIPSLPRDNPHLPPGYEDALRADFPPDWVTKYLDGVWGASEGAVFKELDEKLHDIDNWIDPDHWVNFHWPLVILLSIDHGTTGWTAMVICGIDHDGNIFALQEYYQKDRLIIDHCADMQEVLQLYTRREIGGGNWLTKETEYMLIDPSTCMKTQQGANELQAVADDYRKYGFPCIPAWNALELGINRIKEHLHPIPIHRHPFTGLMGSPSLFISKSRCPGLWADMRAQKKKILPSGKSKYTGRDHALDDLRYIINSQPRRPELQSLDELHLDSLTLMKKRGEDKFLRQFAGGNTPPNSSFRGMGFN